MGSWNYYIEIKTDKITLDRMISEYETNQAYQEAFYFGKVEDGFQDGYNAGFASVIDNFLPANHLIYNFLSNYLPCNLYVRTNGIERAYDFTQKSDFIKFMYDSWKSKIDSVYDQLGVIVLNHKRYHKIRSKLYRKYYIKIPKQPKRENGVL